MAEFPLMVTVESRRQLQSVMRRVLNMKGNIEGGMFKNGDDAITFFVPNRPDTGVSAEAGIMTAWFIITRMQTESVIGKRYLGHSEGIADEETRVNKPPNLMRFGNHMELRNGWQYNYEVGTDPWEGNHRTAFKPGYEVETQTIMPIYAIDDRVLAITVPDETQPAGYHWQDLNVDARLWVTECN